MIAGVIQDTICVPWHLIEKRDTANRLARFQQPSIP